MVILLPPLHCHHHILHHLHHQLPHCTQHIQYILCLDLILSICNVQFPQKWNHVIPQRLSLSSFFNNHPLQPWRVNHWDLLFHYNICHYILIYLHCLIIWPWIEPRFDAVANVIPVNSLTHTLPCILIYIRTISTGIVK